MPASRRPKTDSSMLFLIGHGLQTPLSSIRFGCSRLKKAVKDVLKPDQLALVDGVQKQARMLSGMLNALLLVAKVEDDTHVVRDQEVYVRDFLMNFAPFTELFKKAPDVTCPTNLRLTLDRQVLETLFESLSVILASAAPQALSLSVKVEESDQSCFFDFAPLFELSFLRTPAEIASNTSSSQMVGGVPGLMLSITSSLAQSLGGGVDVRAAGSNLHALRLTLPRS